jgi:mannan polymerase II complex ANP1 subunit
MAKRLEFSVVGLPHYTIWHLYEPSEDDLRHMQEMEKEKKAKEEKDKETAKRLEKIKQQFDDASSDWNKDKEHLKKIIGGDEKQTAKSEKKPEPAPPAAGSGNGGSGAAEVRLQGGS